MIERLCTVNYFLSGASMTQNDEQKRYFEEQEKTEYKSVTSRNLLNKNKCFRRWNNWQPNIGFIVR